MAAPGAPAESAGPDAETGRQGAAMRRRPARGPLVGGLVLVLLLAALIGWLWWKARTAPSGPAEAGINATVVVALPPPQAPPPPKPAPPVAEPQPAPAASQPAPPTATATAEPPAPTASAPAAPAPVAPAPAAPKEAAAPASPPSRVPEPKTVPTPSDSPVEPAPTARAAPAAAPPGPIAPAPPKPAETGPRIALGPVPDPALVARGPRGELPVIAPDGRQAWKVYARPFEDDKNRPRIAIMLGDMGLSDAATNAAIRRLPSAVTLAFAPYASNLQSWIAAARAGGHEVMLQLPMEPLDYPANDPGPNALLTSLTAADNIDRLEWLLGRVTGYIGVTNYMGSKFTISPNDLRPVLQAIKERGLMFLDSRASPRSVAAELARSMGLPEAINNRFLDNEASRSAVDARLEELERIAAATGTAVGIGYPYPVTIERIAAWAPGLASRGIVLAPISAIANRQGPG